MRAGLLSLGLLSGACAAFGYDFDEYQAADTAGTGGANAAGGRSRSTEIGFAAGGERMQKEPVMSDADVGAEAGAGGEACAGAAGEGHAGSVLITTFCEPISCFAAGAQCGAIDDGCGQSLDCGPCFWWFETCQDRLCVILDNPSE
jgi:hypothetical protein